MNSRVKNLFPHEEELKSLVFWHCSLKHNHFFTYSILDLSFECILFFGFLLHGSQIIIEINLREFIYFLKLYLFMIKNIIFCNASL